MCFSAQASFLASGVLATIGYATVRKSAPITRQIAVIPCVFALQQALEGVVWVTLQMQDHISWIHQLAVYLFVFFAGIFWPLWIPYAVYSMERVMWRKILLGVIILNSMLLTMVYIMYWGFTPIHATIVEHHIFYSIFEAVPSQQSIYHMSIINMWLMYSYATATIGSCLLSSMPYVWCIGALSAVAYIVSYVAYVKTFASVWCFFAAIISMIIYKVVSYYSVRHRHQP